MGLAESWKKNFLKDEKKASAVSGNSGLGGGFLTPLAGVTPRSIFTPLSALAVSYQPAVNMAEVDPQFHDALLSAMNKVPAPGLQELLLIMDGLASSLPQNQLCQVALNVVAKKGITLTQIQDELSKRLAALDKDYEDFLGGAERQYSVDVGSKESAITSDDQQIAGLQEKIKELQGHKAKLQEEVSVRKQAIENKKGGLAAAHAKLRDEAASLQARISGGS